MANSAQLLNEYKKYNSNAYADAIEKEYNKRTNYNKDLIDQKNQLQDQAIALPAQLREEYYNSPIRNALAQESLIAGRQANVGSQLGSVTDLLNARGQQYSDILGKAVGGYQNNMENAWRLYQDQKQTEQSRGSGGGNGDNAAILKWLEKMYGKKSRGQQSQAPMSVEDFARTNPETGDIYQGPIQLKDGVVKPLWQGLQFGDATTNLLRKIFG